MELVTLYHYTSPDRLSSILSDGAIYPSSLHGHPTGWVGGRDVRQGAVFLTGRDPVNHSREMIAYNNFGCGWAGALWKTEACLIVTLLKDLWLAEEFRPDEVLAGTSPGRNSQLGGYRHIVAWLGGPIRLQSFEPWCGWYQVIPYNWTETLRSSEDAEFLRKKVKEKKRKRAALVGESPSAVKKTQREADDESQPSKKLKVSPEWRPESPPLSSRGSPPPSDHTSLPTDLRLLTWNICYKTKEPGLDQAAELLLSLSPSLVLLQKVTPGAFSLLLRRLSPQFPHHLRGNGCAIFSSLPLTEVARGKWRNRGFLSARLEVVGLPLVVTCLHLEAELEWRRLHELAAVARQLEEPLARDEEQVWAGDFNSLRREDYSGEEWQEVGRRRKEARLEAPQLAVTSRMTELGFRDCGEEVERMGQGDTSDFGTRVDYIYCSRGMRRKWECRVLEHLEWGLSDHRPVLASFRQREEDMVEGKESDGGLSREELEARLMVANEGMAEQPVTALYRLCEARGWQQPRFTWETVKWQVRVEDQEYSSGVVEECRETDMNFAALTALHRLGALE